MAAAADAVDATDTPEGQRIPRLDFMFVSSRTVTWNRIGTAFTIAAKARVRSGARNARAINSNTMTAHETLSLWESFYVIVGSSAAALTGLLFVGIHNAWDTVTYVASKMPGVQDTS